jgi:porin
MPSVNLLFAPTNFCYANFGAYDANRSEKFGILVGHPQTAQLSEFGAFLIGETGLRWQHAVFFGDDGNFKVGAWGHTGTFNRLEGGQQQGTEGWYAIFNQTLWRPGSEQNGSLGLRTFLEYGHTQSALSVIDRHFGGGISWKGPLPTRPADSAGLCAQYAHLSPQARLPRAYELAVEGFYQVQLWKWATLMPDLQYIVNPGGRYSNALVGTLRLTVTF